MKFYVLNVITDNFLGGCQLQQELELMPDLEVELELATDLELELNPVGESWCSR